MRLSALLFTLLLCGTTFAEPKQGERCEEGLCAKGLTCVHYNGILGGSAHQQATCERRCAPRKGGCPQGQVCVHVADGPGNVCMVTNHKPAPPKSDDRPQPSKNDDQPLPGHDPPRTVPEK